MSQDPRSTMTRLEAWVKKASPIAVAVSGGVDSMTLAVVAGRVPGAGARAFHARSPAVPADASERVRRYAETEGWDLTELDAGEFHDPRYLANPLNRCYYCKSNLYQAMAGVVARGWVSGTNLDDLGDFRPGLGAARERGVRHPYVELGVDKAGVRALARMLELDELAELPASPCLSSRVQSGIRIDALDLQAIDRAERLVRERLSPETVRCRVRCEGLALELDRHAMRRLSPALSEELGAAVAALFRVHRPGIAVRFCSYRRGSAFVAATAAAGASSE